MMEERDWRSSVRSTIESMKSISLNENAPPVDTDLIKTSLYLGVPKGLAENLCFREAIWDLAAEDRDFQERIWIACKRDMLFFINTFCWVFEPRDAIVLPFITWEFQDRHFYLMNKSIGVEDFGMEKSRDMGASWMFLTTFFFRWMFTNRQTFGLVSRTEDAVDKKDDPDCLMWKLDFHYENLPSWMKPRRHRILLSSKNLDNESVITGYSATGDVARGGRKTAFGMDEMAAWQIDQGFASWASTQHVTNSRVVVSTPQGMAGVFAEMMKKRDSSMVKVSVHWSEHPEKQQGLYRSTDSVLEVIDTRYRFEPDYPFVLDGKLRSPWYDNECRRHPIPALIAQELDIDYGGSGFPFFSASMVDQHAHLYGCKEFHRGELDYEESGAPIDGIPNPPMWRAGDKGSLFLWMHLTNDGEPQHNVDYVIGCDIATGVGGDYSTNSVASVCNKLTGEKVAELCCNNLFPDKFADYVIALRTWFSGPSGDAFLIWESNGPGLQFGKHIMQNSSHRVYYRKNESASFSKQTRNPGWHSGRIEKRILLGEYAKGIERGRFINHSQSALDEMLHYTHFPDGSVDHDRSKNTLDPTSAGENHGDRVIADAVAYRLCTSTDTAPKDVKPAKAPYNSFAWRMEQHNEAARPQEQWL